MAIPQYVKDNTIVLKRRLKIIKIYGESILYKNTYN